MRCSPQQTLTSELLIETGLIASAIDLPPGSRLWHRCSTRRVQLRSKPGRRCSLCWSAARRVT